MGNLDGSVTIDNYIMSYELCSRWYGKSIDGVFLDYKAIQDLVFMGQLIAHKVTGFIFKKGKKVPVVTFTDNIIGGDIQYADVMYCFNLDEIIEFEKDNFIEPQGNIKHNSYALNTIEPELEAKANQITDLETKLIDAKVDNQNLRGRINELEIDLHNDEVYIKNLDGYITDLETQLAEARASNEKLLERIAGLEAQLAGVANAPTGKKTDAAIEARGAKTIAEWQELFAPAFRLVFAGIVQGGPRELTGAQLETALEKEGVTLSGAQFKFFKNCFPDGYVKRSPGAKASVNTRY